MNKRIIVTADDFGLTQSINDGIIKGIQDGIITSISMFANAPETQKALEALKRYPHKDVGIHLALTSVSPILSPDVIPSLVTEKGGFSKNLFSFLTKLRLKKINFDEVELEFEAQINFLKEQGIQLSHIDTHQHLHFDQNIFEILVRLAKKHKIPFVRMPFEQTSGLIQKIQGRNLLKNLVQKNETEFRQMLHTNNLKTTDAFFGLYDSGQWNIEKLKKKLGELQEGLTEIMCHPGIISNHTEETNELGFQSYDWEGEFQTFTSPDIQAFIKEEGIQISNFVSESTATSDTVKLPSLSVVIPMYNEKDYLEKTIYKSIEVLRQVTNDFEIIVVDDASTDGSEKMLDALATKHSFIKAIHNKKNCKLGTTLRNGFEIASKKYLLYYDMDLPFDLEEVKKATALLVEEKADMVSAYRSNRLVEGWKRYIYSKVYNSLIQLLFWHRIQDVNFAFKLIRTEVLQKLKLFSEGSFIDAEIIIKTLRAKKKIVQFGTPYFPREDGVSNLSSISVIMKILKELFTFYMNPNRQVIKSKWTTKDVKELKEQMKVPRLKIALINPLYDHLESHGEMALWYNKIFQPLSLMRSATLLREEGHEVMIVDANALQIASTSPFWEKLESDIVILTTSCLDNWQCPFLNLDAIKNIFDRLNPKTIKILNGAHGTSSPEDTEEQLHPEYIVRGEPEFVNQELVRRIALKESVNDLEGLTFKKNKLLVNNPLPKAAPMDQLPRPAYDLVDMSKYNYELMGENFTIMETSRGCPYRCHFCLLDMYRKKYDTKDIEKTMDEIEALQRQHEIKNIYFFDLEFILPKREERAIEFCKAIIKRGLRFKWAIQTRVDSVNDEVLSWLKKAGCVLIHYGVESGNPQVLKSTNKGIKLDQIKTAFKLTKKHGIRSLAYFLFGHPQETREQILETIEFSKELNPDYASFVISIPFPGTKNYELMENKQTHYPITASQTLKPIELEHLRKKANREFYLRPKYVLSQLSRFKSAEEMSILVKGAQKVFIPLIKN